MDEIQRIDRKLTISDVKKFNEILPKVIEITDIREQDIEILAQLDSRISIKVVGTFIGADGIKSEYKEDKLYSPNELCEILKEMQNENIGKVEKVEEKRPVIFLKSKELSGVFEKDEVSSEVVEKAEKIKISVKDDEYENLKADLAEIGKYYPELLKDIEIENTTDEKRNMQKVVDEIYRVKSKVKEDEEQNKVTNITISSNFVEDFDLDFTNAPEVPENSTNPVDGIVRQKVTLKNLRDDTVRIPSFKGKISPNIKELEVAGFDLKNLDISGTGIERLRISSENSENIADIYGIMDVEDIELEAVSTAEFNMFMNRIFSTSSNIHDLTLKNQRFRDRKILEELSVNPSLARLTIYNSQVNDIDGLERFDKRLGLLALQGNDLNISDLERLTNFWENNKTLELYTNQNTYIRESIRNGRQISDDSYKLMSEWFTLTGATQYRENKVDTIDRLLWAHPNVPYYIKDAEIMRQDLKITRNPIKLQDITEIDNVNFNEPYLSNATLLLTIPELERLLSSGKVIPQNVRIDIHDVSELSSTKAKDLLRQMNAKGMHLIGVQIFDENIDNRSNAIAPYSLSEYVYIRDTLDLIVSGINPTEPELDKFAVIYQRLMDSITYDKPATKHNDAAKSIYYAEKLNTSRNLLEGLEEGKCVCAGYADILRNALSLVGIESRLNTGFCKAGDRNTGHAWNQIRLKDSNGNDKWYYTDLTWDAGSKSHRFTLLGKNNFIRQRHEETRTKNIENIENVDYNRFEVVDAFRRAQSRSFNFNQIKRDLIDIPEDPQMTAEILDQDRITEEYKRRKNDMYAKFYGDKDYQREYTQRNNRYKSNEIEVIDNGITYKTIRDYPERLEDEQFLILDKYKECLERMTRYEAGDTSVYTGNPDQIKAALEKDKEYVETRNHTFNQHKNTQKDLATLGKYGEKMPYIPRQVGPLRNIVRAVGNVGIFARNTISPIYRVAGRYVAQPLHRLITRGKDASPYRDNWYHRMVARRDYYAEINSDENPNRVVRNAIKSRVQAVFKAKQGNEAVLRAGAADIRENIISQEKEKVLLQNLNLRMSRFDTQIQQLEQEILSRPNASNVDVARKALQSKIVERDRVNALIQKYEGHELGSVQTDAINDRQHAIASKEANTLKVTVIKGFVKGLTAKYVGPKIHDWLLERGKTVVPTEVTVKVPENKTEWIETTYKDNPVPVYEEIIDTSKNMKDIISANEGKNITGFYSVYGGEKGAATYELLGNEKITAVFQAEGIGGTGLSDTAGLSAPVLTDGTFASHLMDANGILRQDISLEQLIEGLGTENIDMTNFEDVYVAVGDRYWTKLSDLMKDITKEVQVGEKIEQIVDVPGHYENYIEMVDKTIKTTKVVSNKTLEQSVNIANKVGEGAVMVDGVFDVVENLRNTDTDVKSNKKKTRRYEFDEDLDDIPKSKKEYKKQLEER